MKHFCCIKNQTLAASFSGCERVRKVKRPYSLLLKRFFRLHLQLSETVGTDLGLFRTFFQSCKLINFEFGFCNFLKIMVRLKENKKRTRYTAVLLLYMMTGIVAWNIMDGDRRLFTSPGFFIRTVYGSLWPMIFSGGHQY